MATECCYVKWLLNKTEWISIDDVDVEKCELIVDARQEIGTPVFDDDVATIWSEAIED